MRQDSHLSIRTIVLYTDEKNEMNEGPFNILKRMTLLIYYFDQAFYVNRFELTMKLPYRNVIIDLLILLLFNAKLLLFALQIVPCGSCQLRLGAIAHFEREP